MKRLPIKLMHLEYDPVALSMFKDGTELHATVRKLRDMGPVLFDAEFQRACDKNTTLYYMYRDVHRDSDYPEIKRRRLRFDITVIPSFALGMEFNKTAEHCHPVADDDLTYPELYEVLEGEAHYLLQRFRGTRVVEAILVKAKQHAKVLIPPNYCHVTINPSSDVLVMANWVSSKFQSDYQPIKQSKGAAYYELKNAVFQMNFNIQAAPALRVTDALELEQFPSKEDTYSTFVRNPSAFEFLNRPQESPILTYDSD